jgi:hypothetical protein
VMKQSFNALGRRVLWSCVSIREASRRVYPKALDLFRVACYPKFALTSFCSNVNFSPHFCHFTANRHSHRKSNSESQSFKEVRLYSRLYTCERVFILYRDISRSRAYFCVRFPKSSSSFLAQRASFSSFY